MNALYGSLALAVINKEKAVVQTLAESQERKKSNKNIIVSHLPITQYIFL
jgi:hypothetical protein